MKQAAVKTFFSEGPDEVFDDKMHKLAEPHNFTQELPGRLIRSFPFTVPVARIITQRAEKVVPGAAEFR